MRKVFLFIFFVLAALTLVVDGLILVTSCAALERVKLEKSLVLFFSLISLDAPHLRSLLKVLRYPGFNFRKSFAKVSYQRFLEVIKAFIYADMAADLITITNIAHFQEADELQDWLLDYLAHSTDLPEPVAIPDQNWRPNTWRLGDRVFLLNAISKRQLHLISSFDWCSHLLDDVSPHGYIRFMAQDRWKMLEWRCIQRMDRNKKLPFITSMIAYFGRQKLDKHPAMKLRVAILVRRSFIYDFWHTVRDHVQSEKIFYFNDPFYRWSRTDATVETYIVEFSKIYDLFLGAYDDGESLEMANAYFELITDALSLHVPYEYIFRAIKDVLNYYPPDKVAPIYVRDLIDAVGLFTLAKDADQFGPHWQQYLSLAAPKSNVPSPNLSPDLKVQAWKFKYTQIDDEAMVILRRSDCWEDLYFTTHRYILRNMALPVNIMFSFPGKLTPLSYFRSALLGLNHLMAEAFWIDNVDLMEGKELKFVCSRGRRPSGSEVRFLWIAFASHVIYTGVAPFTISLDLFDHFGRTDRSHFYAASKAACSTSYSVDTRTVRRIFDASQEVIKRLNILEYFVDYLIKK